MKPLGGTEILLQALNKYLNVTLSAKLNDMIADSDAFHLEIG